jgi:hypothetical protein
MPRLTAEMKEKAAEAKREKAHAAREAKKIAAATKQAVSKTRKQMMVWLMTGLLLVAAILWTWSLIQDRITALNVAAVSAQIQEPQSVKGGNYFNSVQEPKTMAPTQREPAPESTMDQIFNRLDKIVGSLAGVLGLLLLLKQLLDRKKEEKEGKTA